MVLPEIHRDLRIRVEPELGKEAAIRARRVLGGHLLENVLVGIPCVSHHQDGRSCRGHHNLLAHGGANITQDPLDLRRRRYRRRSANCTRDLFEEEQAKEPLVLDVEELGLL